MFCSETTNPEKGKKEISFWVLFIKVSFSRVSSLTSVTVQCVAVQECVGTGTGSEQLREEGMASRSDISTSCQVKVHEIMAYVLQVQNLKKKI